MGLTRSEHERMMRICGRSDISVLKIDSVSISVLCVIGYFKIVLYFYFGKHFRFKIIFISVSVFISVSGTVCWTRNQ